MNPPAALKPLKQIWARCWAFLESMGEARAFRTALFVWMVYGCVIATIVAIQPDQRTATTEYREASKNWWQAERSLYRSKNGYLYLPHFAALYSPYEMLPVRVGEPLWRLTGLGLLAGALWLASTRLAPHCGNRIFLAATVLVLPSTFASARNGQVNLPLAALFILLALVLARQRWWLGAALLGVTLVLKPIALAPMLVFAALYPRLRLPLVAVIAILAAVIFVHPHPQYVAGEYAHFVENLSQASLPTGFSWCDFSGLLYCLNIYVSPSLQFVLRAGAGLFTLLLCWKVRQANPFLPGVFIVSWLCMIYLMLFNPRTETNSYVMLGAFVALAGAYSGVFLRRLGVAAGCAWLAFLLGTENYGDPIFPWTNLWLKPFATLLLVGVMAWWIFRYPASLLVQLKGKA